eukprot:COSAG03_NODE_1159_length_4691_cov_2.004791_7_plen_83_part_00
MNSTDSQQYARSSLQKLNPLYRPPQEFITAQKFEVRARGTMFPSWSLTLPRWQLSASTIDFACFGGGLFCVGESIHTRERAP